MRTYKEYQEALDILKDLMSTETENNHTPRDYQRATEYIQELIDSKKPKKIVKKYDSDKIHHKMFCPHCGNRWTNMKRPCCDCCGGPINWSDE